MNKGLTKEHTGILHGLAILMMLYHHLFSTPEALGIEYKSLLIFDFANIELKMAWFFKICVAIYAFTSGYGLSRSMSYKNAPENSIAKRLKEDYILVIKRYFSFYMQYLLVFILFVPVGFLFFNKPFVLSEFLLNLLGISSTYNGAWWYVLQYLKMLITLPVIDIIFTRYSNKTDTKKQSVLILVLFLILLLMLIFFKNPLGIALDFMQPAFYFCFIMGFIISRFKLYELASLLLPKSVLYILGLLGFLLVIIFRVKMAKDASSAGFDFIFVPVFSFGFICLNELLNFSKKLFIFFGKYSTFIWLTHVFFYDHYAKRIVMASHFSSFIYLTLLLLSTMAAILLNIIYKFFFAHSKSLRQS